MPFVKDKFALAFVSCRATWSRSTTLEVGAMFSLDEQVKRYLLGQLTVGSTAYFLLDRYWNQLVLYLLVSPLQWLHLVHLLYYTHWEQYNLLVKTLVVLYVTACFIGWESVRIFAFHGVRAVANAQIQEFAQNVATVATEVGKEGYSRAKPHIDKLQESAMHLVGKAKESFTKLMAGNQASNAN